MASVCVVGLGNIGLPTAALIASCGLSVLGVDRSPQVVAEVAAGRCPISEPDLAQMISDRAGTTLHAALEPEPADVFLICVPTSLAPDSCEPNLTEVWNAAAQVAPFLQDGSLLIVESTLSVGATERLQSHLESLTTARFLLAYCPERVLPGRILSELVSNDRVVGALTPAAGEAAAQFFRQFVKGRTEVVSARIAEVVKLAENTFRDVNIAFANELSLLCAAAEVNPFEVIGLANRHPRVNILQPGCGVGGHCITVNPWFLAEVSPAEAPLIEAARSVNDRKPDWVVDQVLQLAATMESPHIVCLGLAFKPDVGDFRSSPALDIARRIADAGWRVSAVEPYAAESLGIELVSLDEARGADIVVGLVRHSQFAGFDCDQLLDFCGIAPLN